MWDSIWNLCELTRPHSSAVGSVVPMSLVVASIHDDDRVTMVCDTKVTFFDRAGHVDEAKTRRTYFEALPKIVLLRPDLLVGITGDEPHEAIEDLIARRHQPLGDLIDHMATVSSTGYVVATLNPARLWNVDQGYIEERTAIRRAWSGDQSAYDHFRSRWAEWPEGTDVPFLLTSSMQSLTSFDPVSSVGGITLSASSQEDGFHFDPGFTFVGPPYLQLDGVTSIDDTVTLRASVPEGGDLTTHRVFVLPGADPTRSALGILIPESGTGLLFRHSRPWEPTSVDTTSSATLVERAAELHQQNLIATVGPTGFN